jgi:hypothetical protein
MITEATDYVNREWWMINFPSLALIVCGLSLNFLGGGLRDFLNKKHRQNCKPMAEVSPFENWYVQNGNLPGL